MTRWLALCALAAVIGVALEMLVVLTLQRNAVASVWELQFGVLWLSPALVLLAAGSGIGAGVLATLARAASRRGPRLALSLALAAGAGATAWGVGGGRHLATWTARGGFTLAVAGVALAATWWLAPRVAPRLQTPSLAAAGAAVGAGLALELVNRFVLVRLYPAFHWALTVAAAMAFALGALAIATPADARGRRRAGVWGGALALALLAAAMTLEPAAQRLARFDNFRLLLLEHAPIAGRGVALAARLAPPPPIATCDDDCGAVSVASPTPSPLRWRDRDVLLVTIDALRADHVSAYGYRRKTTPAIDRLAAEGALFEYAYCATPHTSYSITSLMTGKYMRPLLLSGAGADSETWASLLRTYGYRTAAFYPPAIFFIDPDRFTGFRDSFLGFEYRKVEFLEGPPRVAQLAAYLKTVPPGRPVFAWVHLFAPHEPYEAHPKHDFGSRDVDRYDSEIAFADRTVGRLVEAFRARRPDAVVMVAADHGEEFGEHGGRYHGTTVYEEQVRVPLIVSAPGSVSPRRIKETVQTIDLLPTLLAAIDVPPPPRQRGRDLGALLGGTRPSGPGIALAETEEQSLLAEGPWRLVCERRVGACRLYDVVSDPNQQQDRSRDEPQRFDAMRRKSRELSASHGRFEVQGLRAEGRGWPAAILRGVSGDGEAAEEIASLLDDADVAVRRKAAELLFELRREETAPALRLALGRDEDQTVRRWCAVALTRLDQGAPLTFELVKSDDLAWRRRAALALAEAGDKRGEATLIEWWKDEKARDYTRSRELLAALAKIRSKDAVWSLLSGLEDVRLRPHVARALAEIREPAARVPLVKAFAKERYQGARVALAEALVELGAGPEMAPALTRFLGVPDPLPGGLGVAVRAGILEHVGGPDGRDRKRLQRRAGVGVELSLVVPRGGNGTGVRALVRARASGEGGTLALGPPMNTIKYDRKGEPIKRRDLPRLIQDRKLEIRIPGGDEWREFAVTLPPWVQARPGRPLQLVVWGDRHVEVDALALVPLADELPPPPPEPWKAQPTPD